MMNKKDKASPPAEEKEEITGKTFPGKEPEKSKKDRKAQTPREAKSNKEDKNVSDADANEITEMMTQLELKDKQLSELSDKFMRLAAEYDNFRRRSQKEKEGIYSECISSVVTAWLPVIDNLERASFVSAGYESQEAKKITEGIEMILVSISEVMKSLGVTQIQALRQRFDPNTMDAVMHVEDDKAGESEVVEVFTKGYIKGDKVIRHAMVKVAN